MESFYIMHIFVRWWRIFKVHIQFDSFTGLTHLSYCDRGAEDGREEDGGGEAGGTRKVLDTVEGWLEISYQTMSSAANIPYLSWRRLVGNLSQNLSPIFHISVYCENSSLFLQLLTTSKCSSNNCTMHICAQLYDLLKKLQPLISFQEWFLYWLAFVTNRTVE